MDQSIRIKGELYLSLETVASIYQVQQVWLEEAYTIGLFGEGVDSGSTKCIHAAQLDHVATVVRLHVVLGLDLQAIRRAFREHRTHRQA